MSSMVFLAAGVQRGGQEEFAAGVGPEVEDLDDCVEIDRTVDVRERIALRHAAWWATGGRLPLERGGQPLRIDLDQDQPLLPRVVLRRHRQYLLQRGSMDEALGLEAGSRILPRARGIDPCLAGRDMQDVHR